MSYQNQSKMNKHTVKITHREVIKKYKRYRAYLRHKERMDNMPMYILIFLFAFCLILTTSVIFVITYFPELAVEWIDELYQQS